jgi:hypothetical protein
MTMHKVLADPRPANARPFNFIPRRLVSNLVQSEAKVNGIDLQAGLVTLGAWRTSCKCRIRGRFIR